VGGSGAGSSVEAVSVTVGPVDGGGGGGATGTVNGGVTVGVGVGVGAGVGVGELNDVGDEVVPLGGWVESFDTATTDITSRTSTTTTPNPPAAIHTSGASGATDRARGSVSVVATPRDWAGDAESMMASRAGFPEMASTSLEKHAGQGVWPACVSTRLHRS
jgi:hypothetical protein